MVLCRLLSFEVFSNVVLVAYYRTILVLVLVITGTNNNSFF